MIPGERLAPHSKLLLIAEILFVYAETRRQLERRDVRELTAAVRVRPPRRATGLEHGSLESRLVARRLGNAVDRTLRALPTDSRCLMQSLVLSSMLASRGLTSTVVIGAHSDPEFAAHAWVEHDGRPVLPPLGFYESRLVEI